MASFNTADAKPANIIAAVKSVINQTNAPEETKNLIRNQISSLLMAHQPRKVLPEIERIALRALKADRDIVTVPADKGRSTVIFDRSDTFRRRKTYWRIASFMFVVKSNPPKADTRNQVDPVGTRELGAQKAALTRFYGLSKVHKEGAPLRPIVSLKGTPKYGLAKWLFRRL
ncbi:unnamed protein product [Dibothriocephalus latus]|uniref:Uncharacterized protein n=1 Tax=Dibothriocephalus latus TaxID=60516 RepID=A0A3P7LKW7_DIBLA|nr:unnamed protein product [Dibothriocephalus latus]